VHALTLVSTYSDAAQAFAFSEMALRLNDKFDNARLRGALLHLHGNHVNFWRRHFVTAVPILDQGIASPTPRSVGSPRPPSCPLHIFAGRIC
jgi:hypothetical protein